MMEFLRRWLGPLVPGRSLGAQCERLASMETGTILILCTGNICRSPMACALMRAGLARQRPGLSIESAGIAALIGKPADPLAIEIMAERGIDLTGHRGRQLSREMLGGAELVLVMDTGQRRFLNRQMRIARHCTFRLGEWQQVDVPDPYLGSRADFEQALGLIETAVASWLACLERLPQNRAQQRSG